MNKNNRFDSDIRGRRYKNKKFRKVYSNFPSQFYFADLIDWTKKEGITNSTFVNSNNGYQYILIVVDAYSRYCWMRNIKSKTSKDVQIAFESIFDQNIFNIAGSVEEIILPEKVQTIPKFICTDAGKEFTSNDMETYWKHNNITHIVLSGNSKSMLAERVIQDYKMFIRNKWDGKHWISWTDKFVYFYNHKKHSVTTETPHDVFVEGVQPRLYVDNKKYKNDKLSIGDIVRVRYKKNVLDKKSLTNNWGDIRYTICKIDKRYRPYMYYIKDKEGNEYGPHYAHELLKE